MNSDTIYEVIEEIAAVSSKNAKEDLVRRYISDPEFKSVLKTTYNPLNTFGVASKSIPTQLFVLKGTFTADTWALLAKLSNRDLTGQVAIDAIQSEIDKLSARSATLLRRILLKDLRAGFGASTINKACSGTVSDFPYMRCSLPPKSNLEKWDFKKGVFSQEKADGMFANVDHERGGIIRVTSRQGSEFPLYAMGGFATSVEFSLEPGTQTHGELLVLEKGTILPREKGNGVMNSLLNGGALEDGQSILFLAWDQIPLSEVKPKSKYTVEYAERFNKLLASINLSKEVQSEVRIIPTLVVKSREEAMEHYRELLKQGKEGTILKSPTAVWQDGTSKDQVKFKLEVDVDLKITAIVPGSADSRNDGRAGSLTCVSSCGGLQVDVTVKNEDMRDRIDSNPADWIGRILPVRANSIMAPSSNNPIYSMFLPRAVEANYRTDKIEADSLQEIKDQFQAAMA